MEHVYTTKLRSSMSFSKKRRLMSFLFLNLGSMSTSSWNISLNWKILFLKLEKARSLMSRTSPIVLSLGGVEAVWCILTPIMFLITHNIQKIARCLFYSKPDSKKKSLFLDNISEIYNFLSTTYRQGLHFALAGDANDLKLDSISRKWICQRFWIQ